MKTDFGEDDFRQLAALGWHGEGPFRYTDLRPGDAVSVCGKWIDGVWRILERRTVVRIEQRRHAPWCGPRSTCGACDNPEMAWLDDGSGVGCPLVKIQERGE